jgi:transcriptional regulator with GAF, ATPase, and Fis domain
VLSRVERDLVVEALRSEQGNLSAAARTLGVARQQVQRLVRKYRLRSPA